jgi:ribosomal-protein-alanine N-acetyltransferase
VEFAEFNKGSPFTIRNARIEDIEQIIHINKDSLPENYPHYFFIEHLKEYGLAFFVGLVNYNVVGYVMPRIEWGFSNFKQIPSIVKKGHIVSIAVEQHYRKMGIGSALLRESMKAMKENYKVEEVYLEVRVSNEVAINMYRKNGYKEVKLLKGYYADGEDAYLMACQL